MAVKTKKIKSAGRFGAGYGRPKQRLVAVESIQRKKQSCPFCKGTAKRQAKAIWLCKKCGKKFAGGTFHLKQKD
jgi:large subunit ribosomal protein L37Ae